MPDQKYTVELDFVLSPQAKERVKTGVTTLQQEVQRAQKTAPVGEKVDDSVLKPWKEEMKQVGDEIDKLTEAQKKLSSARKTGATEDINLLKGYMKELGFSEKEINQSITEASTAWNQSTTKMIDDAKQLRRETRLISREVFILKDTAQDLDDRLVKPLMLIGTVITGSIIASAVSYINKIKESNEVTQQWRASTERIEKVQLRIGEVAARTLLPYYEKIATVAEDVASFIEKNPGVVEAGVKVGATALALGTIGKAVTSGIRLYADLKIDVAADKNLLAAQLMLKASGQNLEAAGVSNIAGKGLGGSPLLAVLGEIAVFLGALAGGAVIGDAIGDAIAKKMDPKATNFGFADYLTEFKQALAIDAKALGDFLEGRGIRGGPVIGEGLGEDWFKSVANALGLLEDDAEKAAQALEKVDLTSVANSPQKEAILKAFESFLKDEAEAIKKYHQEREKIVKDALSEELAENRQYASQLNKINVNLSASLGKLATEFSNANAEAAIKYQENYTKIVEEGNLEIARLEEQLQERLNKIENDHADKRVDLLAARDAVGLVRERQRYNKEREEAKRESNREIAERRANIARQLEDLRNSYIQEKAERLREYQERVAEQRAQAAQQLRELQDQHREELARIRLQRIERLRELDDQYQQERSRRYEYFIAQIRDLDATLLGEEALRKQRQEEMLNDLDLFLTNYRNKMSDGLNSLPLGAPVKDAGGYVNRGLYRMAWDNQREFVMSGPTTRAAERIIGRQLDQSNLLSSLGGAQTKATYVDQRRVESAVSKEQMGILRDDAIEAISQVVGR